VGCKCGCADRIDCAAVNMGRAIALSLDKESLDLMIMGKVSTIIQCGEETATSRRKSQVERKHVRCRYKHENLDICRNMFMYMNGVKARRLDAKRQWYLHDEIREFCDARFMDEVCPLPAVPKPRAPTPSQDEQPPKKGKRK